MSATPFDSSPRDLSRREFLKWTTTGAGLANITHSTASPVALKRAESLIDVNVSLGRWPFRRLPNDNTASWVGMLRKQGVEQAWAGSFDALLHKDFAAVNSRLSEECRRHRRGFLVPFGSVNPAAPHWEEDLRRCIEDHRMPGVRLHPNYHGYKLDHPQCDRLLRLASDHRLIVQIALIMEDERMIHPRVRVEPIDAAPLVKSVQASGVRLVLLNAFRTLNLATAGELARSGEVYFEISMLEGVAGLERLLAHVPVNRILFGSHSPFFYFESARLKLQESALDKQQLRAICRDNARRCMVFTL